MHDSPCKTQELKKAAQVTHIPEYAVTKNLVLAGQPQPEDWLDLVERGFNTIINIRNESERAAIEGKNVEAAGLTYIHLPLPAYELETDNLENFNQVMTQANLGNIYLHCRTASRTALLWLLKRITFDGWSMEQAEAELAAAGYDNDDMETFRFCSEDYFERAEAPEFIS